MDIMPNWCWNSTVFYGDSKKIYEIGSEVLSKFLQNTKEGKDTHLDTLLNALGCPQEILNDREKGYWVRAWIQNVALEEDGTLMINYESAWNPCYEVIDSILEEYQPTIKQVTQAEECGNCVYINTDREGLYFKDKYYLDIEKEGRSNDLKYFETLEDAIKEFKDFFEIDEDINSEEELQNFIEAMREGFEEVYITFESFSLD